MFPHELALHISRPQMSKLHKGLAVQLKHADIGKGVHKVHLTQQQFRKMGTAHKNGKGIRLQFNPEQINHHIEKGFFDSLKKTIKDAGSKQVEKLATAGLEKLGDIAVDKIKGKGRRGRGIRRGKGDFEDFFTKTIPSIGHEIAKPYEAVGVNPFDLGYQIGKEIIGPAIVGKGRRGKGVRRGKGDFEDFFTKTIPSAFNSKVEEYKSNPMTAYNDAKKIAGDPVRVGGVNPLEISGKGKRGKGLVKRGKGSISGGALFNSGYTGSGISHNKHIPYLTGEPAFYEAYNPRDTLAIKHL